MASNCGECMHAKRYCRDCTGQHAEDCPTIGHADDIQRAMDKYMPEDVMAFARNAALQERACYAKYGEEPGVNMPLKPRVIEIIEFCRRMNYRKLGVAFCGGLHREGMLFCRILKEKGFEVVSVMCKTGGVDKAFLGIDAEGKINGEGHETMCNPIAQAEVLNAEKTDFNIMIGLCVGHDSLFLKHSDALCTVFAVKDRLMGHNPLAALYTSDTYYKYIKQKD